MGYIAHTRHPVDALHRVAEVAEFMTCAVLALADSPDQVDERALLGLSHALDAVIGDLDAIAKMLEHSPAT